jgi:DNA invertase Pin-like site-specific DNA recombinase
MTKIGYARVSTSGQDLAIQLSQLSDAGCTQIFREKASGAKSDRPQLARVIKALGPDDILIVTRLDRLARSTRDLLNLVHAVSEAGAEFRSLADTWCDTTTSHGKLMLVVLAGLADFERSLIMARTQAGIQRAKDLKKVFGRPGKLAPQQKTLVAKRYASGETMAELAADFGVGVATIHRVIGGTARRRGKRARAA